MHILVVDDDLRVRESLERALRANGFQVHLAASGGEALQKVGIGRFDAIVLDVMMPGLDGLAVCRSLRADGNRLPILMLTARDAVSDRVIGLEAGADDYLIKPFALEELLARVRALLRRTVPGEGARTLAFADMTLDMHAMEARRDGRIVDLRRMELLLLELFMRNPRQLLPRTLIYERVWGYDFGPISNTLDVHIGQLRRKLEEHGGSRVIQTVRGLGYALRER